MPIDFPSDIRHKPSRYLVGDRDDPLTINHNVMEGFYLSRGNVALGQANQATITITSEGRVTIRDNGPGLSFGEPRSLDKSGVELCFTEIEFMREQRLSCLAITNALSEELTYTTSANNGTQLLYHKGVAVSAPQTHLSAEPVTEPFQEVSFLPDPELFGEDKVTFDGLLELFTLAIAGEEPFVEPLIDCFNKASIRLIGPDRSLELNPNFEPLK